ncbi:MAG TPA: GNAT family N-acetyltransferase, partial [Burkholderiaceae bacterium]|nr:GNAT family N-acetyltransferase [Burkholderiaceae bacterium]
TAALKSGSFGDTECLIEAMHAAGPKSNLATMMALLRQSRHDPRVFGAACPALHDAFSQNTDDDFDRNAWSEALQQVWSNYFPVPDAPRLYRGIASVAMQTGDWGLAKQILRTSAPKLQENTTDLTSLALCEARTGRLIEAKKLCTRALRLNSRDKTGIEVMSLINGRMKVWDGLWRRPLSHSHLPLTLEPLDHSHAEAFHFQYRDTQIAVMTGLPELTSLKQTKEWIATHVKEVGRHPYAILHADLGFVGYLSLAVSADAAFFCFWIGVDFQGKGFAGEAGKLACSHARSQGITSVFTSAYHDNARSIRTLTRIGFAPFSARAMPPNDDRQFMFLSDCEDVDVDSDQLDKLIDYYKRENLPLEFCRKD